MPFSWVEPSKASDRYHEVRYNKCLRGRQIPGLGEKKYDGVTPRYYEDKKSFPQKHQFALYFDDETALICTIRMYGFIDVCPLGTCEEGYYVSSSTKPNPMTEGFTYEYFRGLYTGKKKLTAKGFLATQQRIPGVGNGVLRIFYGMQE